MARSCRSSSLKVKTIGCSLTRASSRWRQLQQASIESYFSYSACAFFDPRSTTFGPTREGIFQWIVIIEWNSIASLLISNLISYPVSFFDETIVSRCDIVRTIRRISFFYHKAYHRVCAILTMVRGCSSHRYPRVIFRRTIMDVRRGKVGTTRAETIDLPSMFRKISFALLVHRHQSRLETEEASVGKHFHENKFVFAIFPRIEKSSR